MPIPRRDFLKSAFAAFAVTAIDPSSLILPPAPILAERTILPAHQFVATHIAIRNSRSVTRDLQLKIGETFWNINLKLDPRETMILAMNNIVLPKEGIVLIGQAGVQLSVRGMELRPNGTNHPDLMMMAYWLTA